MYVSMSTYIFSPKEFFVVIKSIKLSLSSFGFLFQSLRYMQKEDSSPLVGFCGPAKLRSKEH